MNNELRELFEIKEDVKISVSEKKQNVMHHILIRLAIFIAGTIGFTAVIFSSNGWDVLGYLIIMFAFHVVWFVSILIEALILHINKKYILSNANLIFSAVILILYGIAYIAIFNPQY